LAEKAEAHSAARQLVDLATQVEAEQVHQLVDLARRALPVLRREREQRQIGYLPLPAALDRLADRLGAPLMTEDRRHAVGTRPAAIAIHDDRQMSQPGGLRAGLRYGFLQRGRLGRGAGDHGRLRWS